MLDLEHSVIPTGLPHGYSFQQSGDAITIKIDLDPSTSESDIVFEYEESENSIYLGRIGKNIPLLCGILFGPVQTPSHEVFPDIIRVTMKKSDPKPWTVVISGPSKKGIDPKSLFLGIAGLCRYLVSG